MFIEIIVTLFMAFVLRILFLVGSYSTDDYVHLWFIKSLYKKNGLADYNVHDSVLPGKKAKPQIIYYLASFFSERYWIIFLRLLNIFLDSFIVFIVYIFSYFVFKNLEIDSINYILHPSTYVALLVATSPILLPVTARMKSLGARVLGYVFFLIYLFFNALIIYGFPVIGSSGALILLLLIIMTSFFAIQISIWTSIIISIAYFNVIPITVTIFCILLALTTNVYGTKDILKFKFAHWVWYFRNAHNGTTAAGRNKFKDHLFLPYYLFKKPEYALNIIFKKSVPIIVLYSVFPFIALIYLIGSEVILIEQIFNNQIMNFLFWISIATASACFLTSLRPLLFLGQAERYFEYSLPCIAVLYVFSITTLKMSEVWLLYMVLFQIIAIVSNYIYTNISFILKTLQGSLSKSFIELIKFLNELNSSSILTIPTKLSFHIAAYTSTEHLFYYRGLNTPSYGFLYLEDDHVLSDILVKPDLLYFKNKYNINMIVISKKALKTAKKYQIKYPFSDLNQIFDNEEYIVISL